MMSAAVIDASIAVKAATLEEYSPNTLVLLRTVPTLHAPAHWLAEAANTLWAKATVRRTLAPDLLASRLSFLSRMPVLVTPLPEILVQAGAIAVELQLTIYDSLYLALAEKLRAPLVSDDRKLIKVAGSSRRFADLVVWIADITDTRH